ncbi:hypothetical protein AEGHOMDF_6029 [Methylobacterium soli]|nr:hypothetical protein AEGHOMDF_6029 [Methylobacterium soli]
MKNGPMKTALASVISMPDWAWSPALTLNRIRNARAFFRKLSLKAEKNWHQNSGAKRRAVMSDRNMAALPGEAHDCLPIDEASNPAARARRRRRI